MTLRSHCALISLSVLATIALVTTAEAFPGQGRSPLFTDFEAEQSLHLLFDQQR